MQTFHLSTLTALVDYRRGQSFRIKHVDDTASLRFERLSLSINFFSPLRAIVLAFWGLSPYHSDLNLTIPMMMTDSLQGKRPSTVSKNTGWFSTEAFLEREGCSHKFRRVHQSNANKAQDSEANEFCSILKLRVVSALSSLVRGHETHVW